MRAVLIPVVLLTASLGACATASAPIQADLGDACVFSGPLKPAKAKRHKEPGDWVGTMNLGGRDVDVYRVTDSHFMARRKTTADRGCGTADLG